MAAPGWRTADPLARRLRQDYAHINFYQLVRLLLLEQRRRTGTVLSMEAATTQELDATVRFRANQEGAFPGREVCAVQDSPALGGVTELRVNNYCISGAQGPLPDPYSEWIRDQIRDGNGDTAAFLDLFNHRFNALRYRLKARNRPALEGTQPEQGRIADALAAIMGMLAPGLAEQLPLPRRALLGMAGLLANARRSPPVLLAVLRTYLQVPVELRPLQGNWRSIEPSDRMALGRCNCRLGHNSFAGSRVWDEQAEITLLVGPIPYSRFIRLLPEKDAQAHGALVDLIRYLLDRRYGCRLVFLVKDEEGAAPGHEHELTARPDGRRPGVYLGHTAWAAAGAGPKTTLHPVEIMIPAFPERKTP